MGRGSKQIKRDRGIQGMGSREIIFEEVGKVRSEISEFAQTLFIKMTNVLGWQCII